MLTILMGKCSAGKDTLLAYLRDHCNYRTLISTTSRPMRPNETDGVDYHFVSVKRGMEMAENGEFLEFRKYPTTADGKEVTYFYGLTWADVKDTGGEDNYVSVLDTGGTAALQDFLGRDKCVVAYIDTDVDIRLQRAMLRSGDKFSQEEWESRAAADDAEFTWDRVAELADFALSNNTGNIENLYGAFAEKLEVRKNNATLS